jgi:hypothetical protein
MLVIGLTSKDLFLPKGWFVMVGCGCSQLDAVLKEDESESLELSSNDTLRGVDMNKFPEYVVPTDGTQFPFLRQPLGLPKYCLHLIPDLGIF